MENLGGLRRPSRYTKRMPSSGGWLIVCPVNQALKGRLLSTVLPSDRHDNISIIFPCLFLLSDLLYRRRLHSDSDRIDLP